MSVNRDGSQRKDGNIDAENLNEGTKGTHEARKSPSLQHGRLELKWNGKQSYDNVSHGEVAYEEVGNGVHLPRGYDYPYHKCVSNNRRETYTSVE